MKRNKVPAIGVIAVLALTGCAAGAEGAGSSEPITIGASLPLTGPLASFGGVIQEGYEAAVNEVNASGGVSVDGSPRQVELTILDNASDATKAADQSRTLILQNGAIGLLGSVTPGLTIPASNIADLEKVPLVTSLTPTESWVEGNADGWQYAWDLFLDYEQMTSVPFETADLTDTNKKVALFTDTEEDGIALGAQWEETAPELGYEIVYRAEFPVGTTDYAQYINASKAAGAEVVIAQMIPPDSFALWKQMKALAYDPKVAFCEKCSVSGAFATELGDLAEGTSVTYLPNVTAPDYEELVGAFQETYGQTVDVTSALASYSAARVLLDAISRADSSESDAINKAIGETDAEYPVGRVTFGSDHAFPIATVALQWQGGAQLQVFPTVDGVNLISPVPGLQ
jgi:branched-chain amino acid transport system substrate-binding protein